MLTISNVPEPDSQRQLLTWMMGQGEVCLREVAVHVGQDEETVLKQINKLIQSGFVQQSNIAGEPYYRTRSAESGDIASQNFWQVPVPGSPLAAIANPSGDYAVKSGSTFDLSVTVSNQGDQNAVIDVFIDEASQNVRQWCTSPHERIALGPNSSGEVSFQFQIPVQTLPDIYDYLLVVDAPQHYPEASPVHQAQRLQILPKAQDAEQLADPTFILQPATNSTNPATLQPGEALKVQVSVHNRSDHVDQFRLTCPDLDRGWFTVRYPEGLETPGLVIQANGLALNPGGKGDILLELHPPADTAAGRYFPSIRLYSDNQPDLVLMDVVYLQILPTYPLTVEFRTILGRVRHQAGQYEIGLTNQGNIERELLLKSQSTDDEELCTYTLTPEQVVLLPGDAASIDLRVKPIKRWRRPFFKKRLFNFVVALEDTQQLPLPKAQESGQLVWEPRPWWQLLMILLCSLGIAAALVFLVWRVFFSPPQIVEFGSESNVYAEDSGDAIRLKWRISNPGQLQKLKLIGRAPNGMVVSGQRDFDFSHGIPIDLKNLCTRQVDLVCGDVQTDARKTGNYIFELQAFRNAGDSLPSSKTDTIQIQPRTLPRNKANTIKIEPQQAKILSFKINGKDVSGKYPVTLDPKYTTKVLTLSWKVQSDKASKVELLPTFGIVRAEDSKPYVIVQKTGSETLTLQVTDAAGHKEDSRAVTIERVDRRASPQVPNSSNQGQTDQETTPILALPPLPAAPSQPAPLPQQAAPRILVVPQPAAPTQPPAAPTQPPAAPTQPSASPIPTTSSSPSASPSPTLTPPDATSTPSPSNSPSPSDLDSTSPSEEVAPPVQ